MPISDTAKDVLEYLKENGPKLSGGVVKDGLSIKDSEFRKAKDELKTYGLVELGRGRGGTLSYIEGVPLPTEAPKRSRAEIMAAAREEKEAKSKQLKKYRKMVEKGLEKAKEDYPDKDLEFDAINLKEDIVFVRLWDKGRADVVGYYV
jgi:hypothetical protein